MLAGAEKVATAVIATLGPNGRNVTILEQKGKAPIVTKDGVTVADNIKSLNCPYEDTGAQIIKQAAHHTAIAAGDGTTTATLLTYELMKSGVEAVNEGLNPVDIKRGMETAVKVITDNIKNIASGIPVTNEIMLGIATISANNDPEIGALVSEAVSIAGVDGIVSVAVSKTNETYVSSSKGMELETGFIDARFINNLKANNVEFINPLIFLYGKKLSLYTEIEQALVLAKNAKRPIVFVSDSMDGEAFATVMRNRLEANAPICVIKVPGFGSSQRDQLEDLAIATGGTVIGADSGITPSKIELKHFGQCEGIIITARKTSFMGVSGSAEKIHERADQLKNFMSGADSSPYEKRILEKRIAILAGKMAVIHIGAPTEIEMKEKAYRIDDAVCAAKAAMEEGVVPGGGTTYMKISAPWRDDPSEFESNFNQSNKRGYNNVMGSINKVFDKIIENSGIQNNISGIQSDPLFSINFHNGYNAKTGRIEDLVKSGVVDPAKVLRCALENAGSAASMLLLTECSIVENQ
jgi:chaperonin GroEL